MKKVLIFLALLFAFTFVKAQNPIGISQPYKFLKYIQAMDSLHVRGVLFMNAHDTASTMAYARLQRAGLIQIKDSGTVYLTPYQALALTNGKLNVADSITKYVTHYQLTVGLAGKQNTLTNPLTQNDTISRVATKYNLTGKVDKITGKKLSDRNYTSSDSTKLAGLAVQVNSDWNSVSGLSQILNKPTIPIITGKRDIADTVLSSGTATNYDLTTGLATKQATGSYEVTTNKQSDLTASTTKYPTVNAVNTGLGLKPNWTDTTFLNKRDAAINNRPKWTDTTFLNKRDAAINNRPKWSDTTYLNKRDAAINLRLKAADIAGKKDKSDSTAGTGYTSRDRLATQLALKQNKGNYRTFADHDSLSNLDEKSYNSLTDKPTLFTLPTLTSGSVLFSNGTTIAQDNNNLFWDNTNKRLGIGKTPSRPLEVYKNASDAEIFLIHGATNGLLLQDLTTGFGGASFLGYNGTTYNNIEFRAKSGAGSQLVLLTTGNIGIQTTSPTAKLHIASGTATANTAPLKLTSGTLLTTPEVGAIEFNTDAYYATITTGAARKQFAFTSNIPTVASGTELDALTDNVKYLTSATISSGHNVPHAVPANGNILQGNGTDWVSVTAPTIPIITGKRDIADTVLSSGTATNYDLTTGLALKRPFTIHETYDSVLGRPNIPNMSYSVGGSIKTGNITKGIISSTVVNDGAYNAFPGLTRLPNGNLIVVYRKGVSHLSVDGKIVYKISKDMGLTWGTEDTIIRRQTNHDFRDPEVVLLDNNSIIISYWDCLGGIVDSLHYNEYVVKGNIVKDSIIWDNPIHVLGYNNNTTGQASKVIDLGAGNLILPIWGYTTRGDTYQSSAVVISHDYGLTWSNKILTGNSSGSGGYSEANGVLLPSGRIVLIVRDEGVNGYSRTYSDDKGLTWSTINNVISMSGPPGKPTITLLKSGAIQIIARYGSSRTPSYSTSWDNGITWSSFEELSEFYDVYSSATLLSGGEIASVNCLDSLSIISKIMYQNYYDGYGLYSNGVLKADTLLLNGDKKHFLMADGSYNDTVYQHEITTGTTSQYFRGDLSLATFPSIPVAQIQSDWTQASSGSLDYIKNKPAITSGTVTSIATGLGLSGGTITSTGTLVVDTASASILPRQRAVNTYEPKFSKSTAFNKNFGTATTQVWGYDSHPTTVSGYGITDIASSIGLSGYLPLSAGSGKPLSGDLYTGGNGIYTNGGGFWTGDGSSTYGFYSPTSTSLALRTSGSNALVINSTGDALFSNNAGAIQFNASSSILVPYNSGATTTPNGLSLFSNYGTGILSSTNSSGSPVNLYLQNYSTHITSTTTSTSTTDGALVVGGGIGVGGGGVFGSLAGTGTRMVVADNIGVLSTQAIPSGIGGGTVVSVSVNSANGFAGTSSGGVSPALTLSTSITGLLLGNGTSVSAVTDNSSNWNTAYTDRNKWDGGSTGLTASTGRASLGLVIGTDVLAYRTFGSAANSATTDFYSSSNPSGYITGYTETDPNSIHNTTSSQSANFNITGNGYLGGSITAAGGGFNSLRSLKNIHADWVGTATDELSKFKLRDFNYKTRPEVDSTLGFIIDEIPQSVAKYVLMNKGTAINLYTLHGLEIKAIQELTEKNQSLEKRISDLEKAISVLIQSNNKRICAN